MHGGVVIEILLRAGAADVQHDVFAGVGLEKVTALVGQVASCGGRWLKWELGGCDENE